MNRPRLHRTLPLLAALMALPCPQALAEKLPDFTELSLTELMQVRVTSVSRKEQTLSDAPASVAVITGDDIDRLGVTTLASALRLSPGMQVARIDAHECAVSARGFDDLYSNKLLVLVDGRTIYNQLYSGVFWNQNTVFLADLDHIEVIRGPGSTQWGANAVNGVVSVSSKDAHDTLGTLLKIAAGDQTTHYVEARQGWKLSDTTALRLYVKDQQEADYGIDLPGSTNGWHAKLAGLRLDWHGKSGSTLTWITEGRNTRVSNNSSSPIFTPPYAVVQHEKYRIGSYMTLARWTQPVGDGGKLVVQSYYDSSDRTAIKFGENREVLDFDAQLQLHPLPSHELVLGTGFREDSDKLTPSIAYNYSITSDSSKIFSAFIQDECTLVPNRLKLNAGIKFEKGSMFGWEPQPSLRAIYTPSTTQSLWASLTRAARTPSRSERNLRMFHAVVPGSGEGALPTAVFLSGTPGFSTEHLTAFEVGYRSQPTRDFSYDLAVFWNHYSNLRDINATPTGIENQPTPHYTLDSFFVNQSRACTYGAELSARWRPASSLNLSASFTTLGYDIIDHTPILPYPARATEGSTPRCQATLDASWTFAPGFSLDVFLSHRSRLGFFGIPAYTGVDARLAWKPCKTFELALVGQDLTDPRHPEFGAYFLSSTVREIARSFHVSATLRF